MRRLNPGYVSLLVATLVLLAAPLSAQTGTLIGRVTDAETGQPVANVQLQLLGVAQGGTVLSSPTGDFRMTVPPGTYALVAQSIGFADERIDGVGIGAGETRTVNVAMRSAALLLNPIMVVASRREEKALDAPASVAVIGRERIEERVAVTNVDHVKAQPGVDIIETGISQSNVVTRGFNNIFSGSLLVITDNRYASVPSLRLNAYNMIPLTSFDPERIEVLLGPASALYGPNSANGVLHVITSSPIDEPGTAVSLAGGERSLFQAQFRHATAFSETLGLKVSGQYFRATDWEYFDPAEPTPSTRDFDNERYSGEVRFDARPWDNGEVVFSAGMNQLVRALEMTGIGAGQIQDWRYSYLQGRFRMGRLFAQAFMNQSDAGDTRLLRTGQAIVDKSRVMVAQAQHGLTLAERLDLIYGLDVSRTEPRTEGTITGRNEDNDNIDEIGGYLHGTLALTDKLDLVGAIRADHHSRLEDPVFSPRGALVFRPLESQTFRATFNRAFSTPTTNNLFLDIVAANIPIVPGVSYGVRTLGVPESGITFSQQCAGGLQNHCMISPLNPGNRVPANAVLFWNPIVNLAVPATLRSFLMNPGQPGDPAITSMFRRFNQEARSFLEDTATPVQRDIDRLRPTITQTLELGYKGILGGRLLVAADVYRTDITDFVGPLRVETPSVFFSPAAVTQFVTYRLRNLIAAGAVTQAQVTAIIQGFSALPIGTVAPDQSNTHELVLSYRNFGELDLWGADAAVEFLATDQLGLTGSLSWVNEECFDFNGDNRCESAVDISLNAPTLKGSAGARWSDAVSGVSLDGRVRYTDTFPMNSGVYVGEIKGYTTLDANVSYRLRWVPGATATLTVNNVLDNMHRQSIGAPELGRLAIVRLMYKR